MNERCYYPSMFIGLALYLIACAQWGKHLQDKNATLKKKQLHGLIAAAVEMVMCVVVGANIYVLSFGVVCAVLGYVTIVYRPKWIVGKR